MFGFFKKERPVREFFDFNSRAISLATREVVHCRRKVPLYEVLELMLASGFRRIPVVTKNKKLVGIATMIDILDYLSKKDTDTTAPVGKVMEEDVYVIKKNYNLEKALDLFHKFCRGGYPVVYKGRLKGFLSEFDFLGEIDKETEPRVGSIMTPKPIVAREHHTVWEVASMMVKGGYRRLPVVQKGILMGIVTPYDVLSYLVGEDRAGEVRDCEKEVKEIMEKMVHTVEPHYKLHRAVETMKLENVGGLPVVEDQELVGMVTERDIIESI